MTRIAAVGSLTAIIVALIAADLAAQEAHPAGDIDFDGVIAGAAAGDARAGRSATSTS